MGLGVCQGCRRFARGESCPFCGAMVEAPKARPLGRRTRCGALVVGSIAAATVTVAGCSAQPAYGIVAMYGGPPTDGATFDGPSAMYGGPPVDAGDSGAGDAAKDSSGDAPSDASDSG